MGIENKKLLYFHERFGGRENKRLFNVHYPFFWGGGGGGGENEKKTFLFHDRPFGLLNETIDCIMTYFINCIIYLSVYPHIYLPIYLYVYMHVCMNVCMYVFVNALTHRLLDR